MSDGGQGYVWGWLGGVQAFIALNIHLPSVYGAVCVGVCSTRAFIFQQHWHEHQ